MNDVDSDRSPLILVGLLGSVLFGLIFYVALTNPAPSTQTVFCQAATGGRATASWEFGGCGMLNCTWVDKSIVCDNSSDVGSCSEQSRDSWKLISTCQLFLQKTGK